MPKPEQLDVELRGGLRSLDAPVASASFNTSVLSEVRKPLPLWQSAREKMWMIFTGACCWIVVSSALLQFGLDPSRLPITSASYAVCQRLLDSSVLQFGIFAWLVREARSQFHPVRHQVETQPMEANPIYPANGNPAHQSSALAPA